MLWGRCTGCNRPDRINKAGHHRPLCAAARLGESNVTDNNDKVRGKRSRPNALRLPLALALALGASHAYALGLGQIEVKSRLNQPLVAEIPLITSSPGEADDLQVRLASPEAFARVGLERPAMLAANLAFSVGINSRGQPVIRITTDSNVSDPFLNFLLEVEWGKGQLVREFTALLDPPYLAPAVVLRGSAPAVVAPAAAPAASVTPSAPPAPVAATAEPLPPESIAAEAVASAPPAPTPRPVAPLPTPPVPAPAPLPVATPPPAPPAPAAAPVAPAAIAAGTLDPVQPGQTLSEIANGIRPPDVSVNQMMAAIQQANPDAFIDGNINLLKRGSVLRIPDGDVLRSLSRAQATALVRQQNSDWRNRQAPVVQPAQASVDSAVATAAASGAPPRSNDGRLEIVPAVADGKFAGNAQSGVSASGGGAELREELNETRETLAARDAELKELRARLQEQEKLQADREKLIELNNSQLQALQQRIASLEKDAAADTTATPTATGATTAPVADSAAASAPQTPPSAPDAPIVAASESAPPAPVSSAADATPDAVTISWWRKPLVWLGGGVLLIGVLVLALLRRRHPQPAPRRSYDIGTLAASMPTAMTAAGDDVEDSEDALGDELRAAVAAAPDDLDAQLDLLRHYRERGDVAAFQDAADAMHACVTDDSDDRWQEALALGAGLVPEASDQPDFGFDGATHVDVDVDDADIDVALAERNRERFDAEAAAEFDSHADTWSDADSGTDAAVDASLETDDAEADWPRPEEAVAVDTDPLAWDVGVPADAAESAEPASAGYQPAGYDETSATKLELARAYLDIGDADGARGMLEEVLQEGTPDQRIEAQHLIDDIR